MLAGQYDITLDFAPDPSIMQARMAAMGVSPPPDMKMESAGAGASEPGASASIFSALPDQPGLRLEARKGPVELLIIDKVQKTPTDN